MTDRPTLLLADDDTTVITALTPFLECGISSIIKSLYSYLMETFRSDK
jgi:hypothetical protein